MRFDENNYYAVSLTSFSAIYSQPKIFVVFCEINWLWKLVVKIGNNKVTIFEKAFLIFYEQGFNRPYFTTY